MDEEFKRQLTNMLIFTYAREILSVCRAINTNRCIGCQYDDPSQLHHDCLTMTDVEIVMFYFQEALQNIEHSKIPNLYDHNSQYLNIPKDVINEFIDKFDWDWWFETNTEKQHVESRIKEAVDILVFFQ